MSCRKPFLKLTTDDAIDHSGDERHLLGKDQDPVPMCIAFSNKTTLVRLDKVYVNI